MHVCEGVEGKRHILLSSVDSRVGMFAPCFMSEQKDLRESSGITISLLFSSKCIICYMVK